MSFAALPSQQSAFVVRLTRAELLALYGFAFVLPLFEAPKNLLWIVYAGIWIANRSRSRNFGGPWDGWDTLIALWIASAYASALFAGLHHGEWASALDVLRYGSVLWFLRRSAYDEGAMRGVLAAVVFGTLAALVWGYYGLLVTGERSTLGLASVGHVNHSAIYLAIAFGVTVAWLRATWPIEGTAKRAVGLALSVAFGLSLIVMESRATLGVGFVIGLCILGAFALRSRRPIWTVVLGTVVLAAAVFAANPGVVKKNAIRLNENLFLAHRDAIWRAGLEAWRQFPLFGVGIGNYGGIDFGRLEQWSRVRGEPFDRTRVLPQSHAHSVYVNTLAERGLAGFSVLLAVLVAWGWALARGMPAAAESAVRWTYWGGALAAWLVAVLVGLVNTTLHHEHALISMVLLGGWLSLRRRLRIDPAARA